MAGPTHHPRPTGPPKPPVPHVPGIYRYTATALGAGMWFWVSSPTRSELARMRHCGLVTNLPQLMYRAKKDGRASDPRTSDETTGLGINRTRTRVDGLEASLGSLNERARRWMAAHAYRRPDVGREARCFDSVRWKAIRLGEHVYCVGPCSNHRSMYRGTRRDRSPVLVLNWRQEKNLSQMPKYALRSACCPQCPCTFFAASGFR
jgi:hypothetical protein